MLKSIVIVIIFGSLFYLLYVNGYMIINAKRAVMFVGSIRGNGKCKASFSTCDGYMKRVIRFKENKTNNFNLKCQLSTGTLFVELLDSNKQKIMNLNNNYQSANINVERNKKYYLVFKFQSVTGNYELSWK